MSIPVGTPCYLIRPSKPEHRRYLGRVVEVVAPLTPIPQFGNRLMHRIDAPWIRAELPRTLVYAEPWRLLPITPPAPVDGERTHEPAAA